MMELCCKALIKKSNSYYNIMHSVCNVFFYAVLFTFAVQRWMRPATPTSSTPVECFTTTAAAPIN